MSPIMGKPHLLKYFLGKNLFNSRQLDEDLKVTDDWADQGFPQSLAVSEAVLTDLRPVDVPRQATARRRSSTG